MTDLNLEKTVWKGCKNLIIINEDMTKHSYSSLIEKCVIKFEGLR